MDEDREAAPQGSSSQRPGRRVLAVGDRPAGAYGTSTVKRSRSTRAELDALDDVILGVLRAEHPATLRGTFYRAVSLGAVEKTEGGYRKVGRQVLKLRRAGRLPYAWITDGTRYVHRPGTWTNAKDALRDTAQVYRRHVWASQPVEVQMFTEKDALVGVVESVTTEFAVPLGVLRGYASESFIWEVAESVAYTDKPVIFYQLGDHDPSGVDAWRAFSERVMEFAPGADVEFHRLAVTPAQITELALPTRPTKRSDSRAAGFVGGSVEVDAIPPNLLRALVREAIEDEVDPHQLEVIQRIEAEERRGLLALVDGWQAGA